MSLHPPTLVFRGSRQITPRHTRLLPQELVARESKDGEPPRPVGIVQVGHRLVGPAAAQRKPWLLGLTQNKRHNTPKATSLSQPFCGEVLLLYSPEEQCCGWQAWFGNPLRGCPQENYLVGQNAPLWEEFLGGGGIIYGKISFPKCAERNVRH